MGRKNKPFGVLDLETDPFKYGRDLKVFCGGFFDGFDYTHYWGENTINYLVDDIAEFAGVVYAHNGGKFDFHFFLDYVDRSKIKIINGRIAEIKIGKATLRDSYLILPVPLSAYKKDDIDYNKFEAENRESHKLEILHYLETDCFYLYEFISKFFEMFPRRLTMAGIALGEIEKVTGEVNRLSKRHFDRFRPYYFGGRVEAIKPGNHKKKMTFVDINSAYPSAMMARHPYGPEYDVVDYLPDVGIELCFIECWGTANGCFPLRDEKGGVSFPRDHYDFYSITGHEYKVAIETGTFKLDKLESVRIPKQTITFKQFIEKFYGLRMDAKAAGDEVRTLFYKLIMNSGYGKLAANPEKYKEYELISPNEVPPEGWDLEDLNYGEYFLYSCPVDPEGPSAIYYDVATAASITGWVRAFLWRSLCQTAGPIYCDTDSILCESPGNLIMGGELGQWSVEAEVTEAWIAGKKLYALKKADGEYKTASKGVRATPEQIKRATGGERVTVYADAPTFSATKAMTYQKRRIRMT